MVAVGADRKRHPPRPGQGLEGGQMKTLERE